MKKNPFCFWSKSSQYTLIKIIFLLITQHLTLIWFPHKVLRIVNSINDNQSLKMDRGRRKSADDLSVCVLLPMAGCWWLTLTWDFSRWTWRQVRSLFLSVFMLLWLEGFPWFCNTFFYISLYMTIALDDSWYSNENNLLFRPLAPKPMVATHMKEK